MRTIHAVIPVKCLLVSLQSGSQIADPQAEIIEVPAGDRFLRWQAKAGHTYFIQTSDPNTHLENWIWTPSIESRAVDIAITYEIGTTAEKAFFQFTDTTNLAAYLAGVQANPNASLTDYDGDYRANEDDVDPQDTDLNWQRAGEASYVLIDLNVPPTAGQARDINDKGEVLFDTGIWSGGEWIPIVAEPYQGIRPGPGENNDSNYEVNASNWVFFNDARQLTGYAELGYSGGPNSGQIGTVLQWTPGDPYSRHAPSALPFFDYNDGEASPIGISDNGKVFSRFAYPALGGPEPVSTARILVTAANGTHQSLLSGADGWHPLGSHAHSDVSGNGWLVANTASTLNGAADYRLALWNPSQTLVSLPAQANDFFFPLHLADLNEGQLLIAAGTQSGIGSEVFLSESGTARHLQSLSGKKIRLFAGDGTGMTSDGQLWRNGELIPMRDLCQQWAEFQGDEWTLQPLKANKHGVYLIQMEGGPNGEAKPQLAVKVVIAPADPKSKLCVAKMEHSLSPAGELDIDADPDRFFVKIPGGAKLGSISIKLSTVENSEPEYDDDSNDIDLVEDGDDQTTLSLLLVSDDVDDEYAGNEVGPDDEDNDRTHKVSLGGKVRVSSIKVNNIDYESNAVESVDPTKKVDVRVIFVGEASDQNIQFLEIRQIAHERFAQLGVKLNMFFASMNVPEGVDDLNFHHDGGGATQQDGSVKSLMHEDARKLVDLADQLGKRDPVTVFVVRNM